MLKAEAAHLSHCSKSFDMEKDLMRNKKINIEYVIKRMIAPAYL